MASRPSPNAVLLNMGPAGDSEPAATPKPTKKQDTLFGPNIGIVSAGPEWTDLDQEKSTIDELTPEIVKNWVAKSKETSQPTTTLQALVNLKRPTLRLSPLANDSQPNAPNTHNSAHALEFEYDCDAPKCGIRVYVVLFPGHPLAKGSDSSNLTRISVFDTVADGGFGRALKLEEGAVLELGEFERTVDRQTPLQSGTLVEEDVSNGEGHHVEASNPTTETAAAKQDRKKRFSTFHFLKHHERSHSVAGPALAVVDAEVGAAATAGGEGNEKDESGVKVIIKLTALDEDGHGSTSANEQVTYLHVVRMGSSPTEDEEDKRPWIVQVVKREAKIGPHTFHLHEIYGLSSHGAQSPNQADLATSSPATPEAHTYPPPATSPAVTNDEPSSECLLCLSSPREVVLLPCRHLVACRECAVNMVEYGAGGNIVHADVSEPAQAPGAPRADENAEHVDVAPNGTGAETPAPTPTQQRRKRRAKGWFCPVCRQPYTSLLRITTTLPSKAEHDSDSDENEEHTPTEAPVTPVVPATTTTPTSRLAALTYPRFFRSSPRARAEPLATSLSDLERGVNLSAVSAA